MTKNEEIKKVIFGLQFLKEKLYNGIYADRLDCIDYAISALKEVQRYRKIGTVEEYREAVEKQIPKKPIDADEDYGFFICPVCRKTIYASDDFESHKFCLNCGQAIQWDAENLEEME